MANPVDLTRRVAIVTTANTGIGPAVESALGAAEEIADKVRALGRRALIVFADHGLGRTLAVVGGWFAR